MPGDDAAPGDAVTIGALVSQCADRARCAARRGRALRHRNPLDGRCARLALFDRAERARAAQRETGLAMGESGRMLSRHHLRDLARPEIGDLDLSADDVDAGVAGVDGDAKLRALDDRGEIGRLDLEMLDVALFHLEQDRTGLLHDRRRQSFLLLGRASRPPSSAKSELFPRRARAARVRCGRFGWCRPVSSTSSCFNETCCAPVPVIQTSPDDLPTDQSSPSAARAAGAVARMNAAVSTLETQWTARMKLSDCRICPEGYRKCFKIE